MFLSFPGQLRIAKSRRDLSINTAIDWFSYKNNQITLSVPSVAKVLLYLIFSNLHTLGTKREIQQKHEMNSIDICSIYRFDSILFCRISFRFQVREVRNISEGAIPKPLVPVLPSYPKQVRDG